MRRFLISRPRSWRSARTDQALASIVHLLESSRLAICCWNRDLQLPDVQSLRGQSDRLRRNRFLRVCADKFVLQDGRSSGRAAGSVVLRIATVASRLSPETRAGRRFVGKASGLLDNSGRDCLRGLPDVCRALRDRRHLHLVRGHRQHHCCVSRCSDVEQLRGPTGVKAHLAGDCQGLPAVRGSRLRDGSRTTSSPAGNRLAGFSARTGRCGHDR